MSDATPSMSVFILNNHRYVSVVITCPYTGKVDYNKVKEVSRALLDMGCYEVSLGDTVGTGTPTTVRAMLETVMGGSTGLPAQRLAVGQIDDFLHTPNLTSESQGSFP